MFVEKTQDLTFETLLENLYVSWCHFETGRGWGGDGHMRNDVEPRAVARLPAFAATRLFKNTVERVSRHDPPTQNDSGDMGHAKDFII